MNATLAGALQQGQSQQQAGLAGPVGSHQRHHLAGAEGEPGNIEDLSFIQHEAQVSRLQQCLYGHGHPTPVCHWGCLRYCWYQVRIAVTINVNSSRMTLKAMDSTKSPMETSWSMAW